MPAEIIHSNRFAHAPTEQKPCPYIKIQPEIEPSFPPIQQGVGRLFKNGQLREDYRFSDRLTSAILISLLHTSEQNLSILTDNTNPSDGILDHENTTRREHVRGFITNLSTAIRDLNKIILSDNDFPESKSEYLLLSQLLSRVQGAKGEEKVLQKNGTRPHPRYKLTRLSYRTGIKDTPEKERPLVTSVSLKDEQTREELGIRFIENTQIRYGNRFHYLDGVDPKLASDVLTRKGIPPSTITLVLENAERNYTPPGFEIKYVRGGGIRAVVIGRPKVGSKKDGDGYFTVFPESKPELQTIFEHEGEVLRFESITENFRSGLRQSF